MKAEFDLIIEASTCMPPDNKYNPYTTSIGGEKENSELKAKRTEFIHEKDIINEDGKPSLDI